jgi:hypothetical protein
VTKVETATGGKRLLATNDSKEMQNCFWIEVGKQEYISLGVSFSLSEDIRSQSSPGSP